MSDAFDLVVIGAGPAGAEAAIAASGAGLTVCVVDEGPAPGGQVWRAPRSAAARSAPADADRRQGDDLRARLSASAATVMQGAQVWDARPGFTVSTVGPDGPRLLSAPRLVLATGAIERLDPFPGWTIPGVFGLAAATALIKGQKMLPGTRIVVAGQGPLLMAVAAKALELGLRPVAVVDANGPADWARAATGFARDPALMGQGLRWVARLAKARLRYMPHTTITAAEGDETLRAVMAQTGDGGAPERIEADTLYIGGALQPADELHRLLGAAQVADPLQVVTTRCDADRRASVEGLYVAGDGGGIRGAASAAAAGRVAGLAAALDHGALSAEAFDAASRDPRRRLSRLAAFADASCRLMRPLGARLDALPKETILCRCEDVSVGDLRAAMADGARDLNQAKHFTRIGMGPCQGRMCMASAARVMQAQSAETGEGPSALDLRPTPRAPVRPVEMADLVGDFDYDDIPVPPAAPL